MLKKEAGGALFQWLSVGATLSAVILFMVELVGYSRSRATMPSGLQIGGVPVGGLGREQALAQVANLYATPVELLYQDNLILLSPDTIGFRLDTEAILAAADQVRTEDPFWQGFWDFLWRRTGPVQSIALRASFSEEQLRKFLQDVAARYDQPASPVRPVEGALTFSPGAPGKALDVETSLDVVATILQQPTERRAGLTLSQGGQARPTFEALEAVLKQHLSDQGYEGLVDMVVVDLRTGAELHLTRMQGRDLPEDPDIAFAGMDIMKIAIMLASFYHWQTDLAPETSQLLSEAIELSGKDKANLLLAELGEGNPEQGAQVVTERLRQLGLASSFLAGAYDQAEPPPPILTPANQRVDIQTAPDPLMQTTPTDVAFLLVSLYQCSSGPGGAISVVFSGEITPRECQTMLDVLSRNRIGVLIEAGVPEGTHVAHKQGWTGNTNGDAAVVYTPGGDYVLTIFLWQPEFLPWEESSPLMADLSRAVYNYFNAPVPVDG